MAKQSVLIKFNPAHIVLPLVSRANDDPKTTTFLGTGFFIGKHCRFATAFHNLPADLTTPLYVVPLETITKGYLTKLLRYDKEADLAVLEVDGYRPSKWFAPYPHDALPLGESVTCIEFGPTTTSGGIIELSMAIRVGNITRHFLKLERFGKAGNDALELSFPALRGASGAPVLIGQTRRVVGIVKANIGYHLIPAQIEEYVAEDGKEQEKVMFMMPQAIAIHVLHLRNLLED